MMGCNRRKEENKGLVVGDGKWRKRKKDMQGKGEEGEMKVIRRVV